MTRSAYAPRVRREQGQWALAWRRLLQHQLGMVGLVVLLVLVLLCVFGPLLIQYEFDGMDLRAAKRPPTPGHWLGTDEMGRDALVRILHGGRISLAVGFIVAITSGILGAMVGGICGYLGGRLDNFVMRVVDLNYTLPRIVLLLVLSKVAGPGLASIVLILVITEWTGTARLVRGVVLSIRENSYIEAARSSGASGARLFFQHVLPNSLSPLIVAVTLDAGAAIRAETTLSYLGLGIQPPTPSWGNLLSNASSYFFTAPWQVYFPGVFIFLALMSFNLVGDALRDANDPRMLIRAGRKPT
jgi:ABC-type dipeptide/oligopeptide/nickel transport system permease subunit